MDNISTIAGDARRVRTVAVFGGSISAGAGVAGHGFADLLPSLCSNAVKIKNFSVSGQSILDTLNQLPGFLECKPDVVIIAHGGFDAVVRPTGNAIKWIPPRWRAKGWLDPRPYYSRRLIKGTYQRLESAIRWRYRILLLRVFGGAPWVPSAEFEKAALQLVSGLLAKTSAHVVLLTPMGVDERHFPRTAETMSRCTMALRAAHEQHFATNRVRLIDASQLLDRNLDFFIDGFHPNAGGHLKLAHAILPYLDGNPSS